MKTNGVILNKMKHFLVKQIYYWLHKIVLYNFAPSEHNVPITIFVDKDCDELAFSAIFCGQTRLKNNERHVKVNYEDIVNI